MVLLASFSHYCFLLRMSSFTCTRFSLYSVPWNKVKSDRRSFTFFFVAFLWCLFNSWTYLAHGSLSNSTCWMVAYINMKLNDACSDYFSSEILHLYVHCFFSKCATLLAFRISKNVPPHLFIIALKVVPEFECFVHCKIHVEIKRSANFMFCQCFKRSGPVIAN